MDPVSGLLAKFDELIKELHRIARSLASGGEKYGDSNGFLVSPAGNSGNQTFVQVLGENPNRTKWSIENVDAANDLEWTYRPDRPFGSGFKIFKNGGAYTDDAMRVYKGPIYVRCDPALAAATQVQCRAGEEWK